MTTYKLIQSNYLVFLFLIAPNSILLTKDNLFKFMKLKANSFL